MTGGDAHHVGIGAIRHQDPAIYILEPDHEWKVINERLNVLIALNILIVNIFHRMNEYF